MNSKKLNDSENEKLDFNEFNFAKSNKNKINYKFLIYILFSFLHFIALFIIIYLIKNNIKFEKNIKKEFLDKIQFLNLNIIKENSIIYKNQYNIYNLLSVMGVMGHKKIRIGRKADGGYILLEDLKNIKIAYSFGISGEVSFDKELTDKNIDVYMYDHTIFNLPFENPRFHWKKIGLSGKKNSNNLKILPDLLKENGHTKENDLLLKMDIESHEWEVLENLPLKILNQFKYIVGEFHFSKRKKYNYFYILKKLQITHQIFHLHCNNCGRIITLNGYKICNLLEISFIRKSGYKFYKDNNKFPIKGLDFKNCNHKLEITDVLNYYI